MTSVRQCVLARHFFCLTAEERERENQVTVRNSVYTQYTVSAAAAVSGDDGDDDDDRQREREREREKEEIEKS